MQLHPGPLLPWAWARSHNWAITWHRGILVLVGIPRAEAAAVGVWRGAPADSTRAGENRLDCPDRRGNRTKGKRLEQRAHSTRDATGVGGREDPGAKKRDYWWTVLFTDPIAIPLVRFLARRRWMSADRVSILAAELGFAVGPVLGIGTRASFIAGGLLFQLAFIVDCIDGKLARAMGTTSERGAALDVLGDAIRRASASLGIVVGIWRAEAAGTTFWFAVAYVVLAYFFIELSGGSEVRQEAWFKKDAPPPDDRRPSRWTEALARRRLLPTPGMPDVQALVFVIGPVTSLFVPALALGAVMVAGGALISIRRRLR
jgi:phosphatidylglycerophosphate synthase